MSVYASVFIVLAVCLGSIGLLYLLGRILSGSKEAIEVLPYQSGWAPDEHALSRFHARWYPMTLVFLAFDVEMLFMYPWAVVVAQMGAAAVIEMFVFLGVLLVGIVWAWREGAFRWV